MKRSSVCASSFLNFLLFFSQCTALHWSALEGCLEVCRLLVESKADVAVRDRCFSPPPSHHLSLTICLAALALHSDSPSTSTKPTSLHTCAASARLNDAPPRAAAAAIKAVLVRVAAAVFWGGDDGSFVFCYILDI